MQHAKLICLSGTLIVTITTLAAMANPISQDAASEYSNYRIFIERNPFSLRSMSTDRPDRPGPVPKIILTGITSIGGLRAFFMSEASQGKQPEFYSLGINEKKGDVEVLEINLVDKAVRVRNGATEAVMGFATNGVKPPAAPIRPARGAL
jgi:hypothetical protein